MDKRKHFSIGYFFRELSTGAQNDLQRATDLARQMITRYGMSDSLGPATLENARSPFLPETGVSRAEYSERTAEAIDEEVRKLLLASEGRVRETLTQRSSALNALAQALLKHETVDRQGLTAILASASAESGGPRLQSSDEEAISHAATSAAA